MTVSWCERLLIRNQFFDSELLRRADAVRRQVLAERLGGTWWGVHPATLRRHVVFAAPTPSGTRRLLMQALAVGTAADTVLVLPRPSRLGIEAGRLGVAVLHGVTDPWPLLEAADCVFAPGRGDEALAAGLLGTPATCDSSGPLALSRDSDRLAVAGLLLGARYADPFTGKPTSCENFVDMLSDMRRGQGVRSSVACCTGISFWKRRRVAAFLGGVRTPCFRRTAAAAVAAAARREGVVTVWPSRSPRGLAAASARAGVPVVRMEDGFIRSVGLGADFLPPLSLVLDRTGLYYDATGASDLETLLAETNFSPALLRRAAALRSRIVADGVTKYNLSDGPRLARPAAGRVVLVPGQVADDRSVLLGGAGVAPGLDLLHRVRRRVPDAFILYKPHPDVEAGHRAGAVPDAAVLSVADQVWRGGSMADILDQVDEVHTLTSLTGFEALLRRKPVTTYGQPFYAGWGLTTDAQPPVRRRRILDLDELVAGTLILYPSYIDPVTLLPCGPEVALDRLRDPALHRATWLVRARRLQGQLHRRFWQRGPADGAAPAVSRHASAA